MDLAVLDKWIAEGFCLGAGDGKKSICLEQAVSLSLGLGLTEYPEKYKSGIPEWLAYLCRNLNDSKWSSGKARAFALQGLAFEQVNSEGVDNIWFSTRIGEFVIKQILPKLFRQLSTSNRMTKVKTELCNSADKCEKYASEESLRASCEFLVPFTAAHYSVLCAYDALMHLRSSSVDTNKYASGVFSQCVDYANNYSKKSDEYLTLFSNCVISTLRESKQRAGISLFRR